MALIKCPECSREISDRATACPGCGAPVATDKQPPTTDEPSTKTDEGSPKPDEHSASTSDGAQPTSGPASPKKPTTQTRVLQVAGTVAGLIVLWAFLSLTGIIAPSWVQGLADLHNNKQGLKPVDVSRSGGLDIYDYGRGVSWRFGAVLEVHPIEAGVWAISLQSPLFVTPSQFGTVEHVTTVKGDDPKPWEMEWYVIKSGPLKGKILAVSKHADSISSPAVLSYFYACDMEVRHSGGRAPRGVCEKADKIQ